MDGTSITPKQEKQYRRLIEDAAQHGADLTLKKVVLDKESMQVLFGQGDKLKTAIAETIVDKTRELATPSQIMVAKPTDLIIPANLNEILEGQVGRLMEVNGHKFHKISQGKYKDQLMDAVLAFRWSEELVAIGLDKVAIVDYRLSGEFLAKTAGANCYIKPDNCTNYQGVETPVGILVIQAQWGSKYRNKTPHWCRQNFHHLELGGVVKEGLTAVLYHGKTLLEECRMDLSGSVSEFGDVPDLYLWHEEPVLYYCYVSNANPRYGSVSRGR